MSTEHLYIASCVPDGGIEHYVRTSDGYALCGRLACDRPMYMLLEEERMDVLLRATFSSNRHSGLLHLKVDRNGALHPIGEIEDTQGEIACHLCRWKGKTYVANYLGGSIAMIGGPVHHSSGRGFSPPRQDMSHPHFIGVTPDKRYLLATDLGLDTLNVYDAQLRVLTSVHTPSGHGARHLAFSEDGRYIFCINELVSTISVFAYHDGTLTLLETCPALKGGAPGGAAIRVQGELVYTSHRGADLIAVHRWTDRHLVPVDEFSCGGQSPRDFILNERGLLCANEESDQVAVLPLRAGRPCDTGERISVRRPLCLVRSDTNSSMCLNEIHANISEEEGR